jgi:hypothetical protein
VLDTTPAPALGDEHWAPDHLVLAQRALTYAGRLFVERDASGVLLEYSPLAGMAAVEQRYPIWALGPFGRIEPEFEIRSAPGVFALVTEGVTRYVSHSRNLAETFGLRKGIGHISRRDAQRAGREERCRLNRLVTAEARAGRTVDVYVLALDGVPWWKPTARAKESPDHVAAEILRTNRGDWHPPE